MDMVVTLKNIWIIHIQSPTNLPKSMWKLVFNVANVIFDLEVLKEKCIKSKGIMYHLKLSKTYVVGIKKLKNKIKIATHIDLWKYGQILTIQKSLTIKQLRF